MKDDVVAPLYIKWRFFFDIFFTAIDRKNGNWQFLPFNCSVVDQPYKTMQILETIRNLYFERLEELNKVK